MCKFQNQEAETEIHYLKAKIADLEQDLADMADELRIAELEKENAELKAHCSDLEIELEQKDKCIEELESELSHYKDCLEPYANNIKAQAIEDAMNQATTWECLRDYANKLREGA